MVQVSVSQLTESSGAQTTVLVWSRANIGESHRRSSFFVQIRVVSSRGPVSALPTHDEPRYYTYMAHGSGSRSILVDSGLYKGLLHFAGLLEKPDCETSMSQTLVLVMERFSMEDESSVTWEARSKEGLAGAETCLSSRRGFQLATLQCLIAILRRLGVRDKISRFLESSQVQMTCGRERCIRSYTTSSYQTRISPIVIVLGVGSAKRDVRLRSVHVYQTPYSTLLSSPSATTFRSRHPF